MTTNTQRLYQDFLRNTEKHELAVIKEDGLYRHLRMGEPGRSSWSWSIMTWPGYLAIHGDVADGFCFRRLEDMIEFFEPDPRELGPNSQGMPQIDYRYWAEKLTGHRSEEVKVYSREVFMNVIEMILEDHEELGVHAQEEHEARLALLKRIHELRGLDDSASSPLAGVPAPVEELWSLEGISDADLDDLDENWSWKDEETGHAYYYDDLYGTRLSALSPGQRRAELREKLQSDAGWHSETEIDAHRWLLNNEQHLGTTDASGHDLRAFDSQFMLACWAIDLTVRRYLTERRQLASPDGSIEH